MIFSNALGNATMVENIEQRIYALARLHNGVYLINNEKKQKLLNADTDIDTDMLLDVDEAEELMDEFFREFNVDRGSFNIKTIFPMSLFPGIYSKNPRLFPFPISLLAC